MMKKMKNKKGFTLMEMLIVVAIIAVLVIIAIPTFNNALAKSRAATDLANIRSGYAAAQVEAMTSDTQVANTQTYYLQEDGSVVVEADNDNPYSCVGDSSKVADNTTIGGVKEVNTDVSWGKGSTITYEVTDANGEISVDIKSTGAAQNP